MTEPDETVGQEQSPEEPLAAPTPASSAQPLPAPQTGHTATDAALARLDVLDDLPVSEHVAVYDETHRDLQDALADLDEE